MTEQEAKKEEHKCFIAAGDSVWIDPNRVHRKQPKDKVPYVAGRGKCSICGKVFSFPIIDDRYEDL